MNRTLILFLSLIPSVAYGQMKNRCAVIDTDYEIIGLSVSSNDDLKFVTSQGKTYITTNSDSIWHSNKSLVANTADYDDRQLDQASFFNKDTAIITGYISGGDSRIKNGLYLTIDGGQSWKLIDYGGNDWIYDAFVDKQGHAWIGGSSGRIYYSKDFGQHWKILNSPFVDPELRMKSIYMMNSKVGIAGALFNAIYVTTDNWTTYKKIRTPFTQNKYNTNLGDSYQDINKVCLWKNYLVVNQYGYIYYSNKDKIFWKKFPVKIINFEQDPVSKRLYALTDDFRIISFTTPTDYAYLSKEKLTSGIIKLANRSVYILNNSEIFKVNSKGVVHNYLLTNDRKINEVYHVTHYNKLTWGVNGIHLYLSENEGKDWIRENILPIDPVDIHLLNDSAAILRDRNNDSYTYSLKNHALTTYRFNAPISDFLSSPIYSMFIRSGSDNCSQEEESFIEYKNENRGLLFSNKVSIYHNSKDTSSVFINKANGNVLNGILTSINMDPYTKPTLSDFHITKTDEKNYLKLVTKRLKTNTVDILGNKKKLNKEFYYSVPNKLHTLKRSVLSKVLDHQESIWSNCSNLFKIEIINETHDTLHISRRYYKNTLAWNLPWVVEFKGKVFNSNSITLSKWIGTCIPNGFKDKDVFDNKNLIMNIADYLYNK